VSVVVDCDARLEGQEARFGALMGAINVAVAQVVLVVEQAIADELWGGSGARSIEHWVCFQTGVSPTRARRLVTMARRRAELPACWGLFEAGLVTEDVMYAIALRVPASRDRRVAEMAPQMMYGQLVHWLRSLPELPSGERKARREERAVEAGEVAFYLDDDGRLQLRGDLPADDSVVVERALRAARDHLFRLRHPDAADDAASTSVTWADALAHLSELGLSALDGSMEGRRPGDRFQVQLHVDAESGDAWWHMGDLIPDVLRRYLLCDSDVRAVVSEADVVIGFTRRSRTVDDKTRALIEHRDRGCRVPGCDQRRWLHIHHLVHVEDGGETVPDNLCALCPVHHRMHHAGVLAIEGDPTIADGLVFTDRWGQYIGPRPPNPPAHPPDPPDPPFRHPIGERAEWKWIYWRDTACGGPNLN
jgi:hypothetical protein